MVDDFGVFKVKKTDARHSHNDVYEFVISYNPDASTIDKNALLYIASFEEWRQMNILQKICCDQLGTFYLMKQTHKRRRVSWDSPYKNKFGIRYGYGADKTKIYLHNRDDLEMLKLMWAIAENASESK